MTSFKVKGRLYTNFILEPGYEGLFDKQLGELAHVQLGLLAELGPLSRNQLARKATETEGVPSHSSAKSPIEMANAALRALSAKGFVDEQRKLFTISGSGQDTLERYPEQFSPLFIQKELLNPPDTVAPPVLSGWEGLRRITSRLRR